MLLRHIQLSRTLAASGGLSWVELPKAPIQIIEPSHVQRQVADSELYDAYVAVFDRGFYEAKLPKVLPEDYHQTLYYNQQFAIYTTSSGGPTLLSIMAETTQAPQAATTLLNRSKSLFQRLLHFNNLIKQSLSLQEDMYTRLDRELLSWIAGAIFGTETTPPLVGKVPQNFQLSYNRLQIELIDYYSSQDSPCNKTIFFVNLIGVFYKTFHHNEWSQIGPTDDSYWKTIEEICYSSYRSLFVAAH